MASTFGQWSFALYDLSNDYDQCLRPKYVVETTPGWSDPVLRLLAAIRWYLNSPPESPKNWGQVNQNVHDYHSNPMEISSTFWLLEVTNWWHQHEETQSKYVDLSNEAHNIISIIPHGVWVEATSSLWLDDIGWSQSKTPGKRHREKVVVRRFARV
jgi:hypothetical protein